MAQCEFYDKMFSEDDTGPKTQHWKRMPAVDCGRTVEAVP